MIKNFLFLSAGGIFAALSVFGVRLCFQYLAAG